MPFDPKRKLEAYPSLAARRVHWAHNYASLYAPACARLHSLPRGVACERIADRHGRRELVFASAWEAENDTRPYHRGGRSGVGVLRNLLNPRQTAHRHWPDQYRAPRVGSRERRAAATVIQWLGSNVGFAWLTEVIEALGYRLVRVAHEAVAVPRPYRDVATGRDASTPTPPTRRRDARRRAGRRALSGSASKRRLSPKVYD